MSWRLLSREIANFAPNEANHWIGGSLCPYLPLARVLKGCLQDGGFVPVFLAEPGTLSVGVIIGNRGDAPEIVSLQQAEANVAANRKGVRP